MLRETQAQSPVTPGTENRMGAQASLREGGRQDHQEFYSEAVALVSSQGALQWLQERRNSGVLRPVGRFKSSL